MVTHHAEDGRPEDEQVLVTNKHLMEQSYDIHYSGLLPGNSPGGHEQYTPNSMKTSLDTKSPGTAVLVKNTRDFSQTNYEKGYDVETNNQLSGAELTSTVDKK